MAQRKGAQDLTGRLARPLDVAARNVRAATAVAPARPAYAAGLRAALATVVPLLAAQMFNLSGATWMSLAGFSGALADRGGSYRSRAGTIASVTGFGTLAVLLGAVVSHQLVVAVVLTFAVAVVCGLGRAWGNSGAAVGGSVLNMFVISLAWPALGPSDAFGRGAYTLLGGAWAALLALVLWPIRPYRPARLAMGECYRTLADYVTQVVRALESTVPSDDSLPAGSLAVRAALENVRATLATIRRGRSGETSRGDRLLVLHTTADQMYGNLLALIDTIEAIPPGARNPRQQTLIVTALREVDLVLRELATRVEEEKQSGVTSVHLSGALLSASLTPIPAAGVTGADASVHELHYADAQYTHAAALIDRIATFAGVAAATIAALDGATVPTPMTPPEAEEPTEQRPLLAPLRSVLGHDSLVLRHALRLGTVTAAAVLLAGWVGLPRGYWVTITVVIILQPYTGATTLKAVQRVIGTVVGGILTAALGAVFHDARAILVMSFVFAAVSVALLPINYTAFSVFLTPTFVLLAEASAGDWHLAGVRVLDTVVGGALALIGAQLLWPAPEWKRLPTYMAAALRANRDYLRTVVSNFADRSDAAGRRMRDRRRDAALAAVNAEESFQRLLAEHGDTADTLAPVMTFLTYTRRLSVSIAALAVSRHALDASSTTTLEQFVERASHRLDAAAARLNDDAPDGTSEMPVQMDLQDDLRLADPVLQARLARLTRQLDTLVSAVDQVVALGTTSDSR
jgi:uncharacterized membrane protein YccC